MVRPHKEIPLRLAWQRKRKLHEDIVKLLSSTIVIGLSNVKWRVLGCPGYPIAKGKADVNMVVPGKRQPPQVKGRIELLPI